MKSNGNMRDRLTEALKGARADYAEIRVESTRASRVVFRGRRLELAGESVDAGGNVRVLFKGHGWGVASFTTLDDVPGLLRQAEDMSQAITLEQPIKLADSAARTDEVIPAIDGDPFAVPLSEKRRYLEHLNGLMLAESDKIVDTSASYYDDRTEWWYANSEGTWLHELRPEIGLSAQATARLDGRIERSLESLGLRKGWQSVQDKEEMFHTAARRAVVEHLVLVLDALPALAQPQRFERALDAAVQPRGAPWSCSPRPPCRAAPCRSFSIRGWRACSCTRRLGTCPRPTSSTRTRRRAR